MFIRAARETHSGELVLVVRPNGKIRSTVSVFPCHSRLLFYEPKVLLMLFDHHGNKP